MLKWFSTVPLLTEDALQRALTDPTHQPLSRYASIATDRLVELCMSRRADLSREGWTGADGQKALNFLLDLASLNDIEGRPQHTSTGSAGPLTIQAPSVPGQVSIPSSDRPSLEPILSS